MIGTSTNIILLAIAILIFLSGLFLLGALARVHAAIQVLTQIVAIGMHRANLVRTEEEVEADMREAQEQQEKDEDLEAMKAETDDLVL